VKQVGVQGGVGLQGSGEVAVNVNVAGGVIGGGCLSCGHFCYCLRFKINEKFIKITQTQKKNTKKHKKTQKKHKKK
jgi:hypothetical protein